jgi:hypothetical protein
MTTYIDTVNAVLRRLRQSEVSSVSETDYSKLIGDFVRQALSEVEDAWNWNELRTTIQVTTVNTVFTYSLTGAGNSYVVLHVFEDTEDYRVRKAPSQAWMTQVLLHNDITNQKPTHWDINGVDGDGDPVVNLYPPPDKDGYVLNFDMKIKSTLSDDTDTYPIADLPVILLATALAVEERGDDQGLSLQVLENQYQRALSDSVAYNAALNADETVWEVV